MPPQRQGHWTSIIIAGGAHGCRDGRQDQNAFQAFAKDEHADVERCRAETNMRRQRIGAAGLSECLPDHGGGDRQGWQPIEQQGRPSARQSLSRPCHSAAASRRLVTPDHYIQDANQCQQRGVGSLDLGRQSLLACGINALISDYLNWEHLPQMQISCSLGRLRGRSPFSEPLDSSPEAAECRVIRPLPRSLPLLLSRVVPGLWRPACCLSITAA